jgi:hypothetical protein
LACRIGFLCMPASKPYVLTELKAAICSCIAMLGGMHILVAAD